MRKVLIIAYYWPPSGGGGVQRWLKFTRYLPDFGWSPVAYVPYNPQYPLTDMTLMEQVPGHVEVIKGHIWEARRIYRRLKKIRHGKQWSTATEMDTLFFRDRKKLSWFGRFSLFLRSNLFIPDSRSLWIRPSVRRLRKWLKTNSVDAIISTGPPHSCHLIGMHLHLKTGIPWIADFRDPWTDIDYFHKLLNTKSTLRKHHQLQMRVLQNATRVITVSPSWARLFESYGAPSVDVITNGFDGEDIRNFGVGKNRQNDHILRIASIGTLEADRNPVAMWKALQDLAAIHPKLNERFQIHFAGKVDMEMIPDSLDLRQLLHFHGYVSHKAALQMMSDADALLLVLNQGNDRNAMGRIPGKLFEYLAFRKPVILIGNTDSDAARIVAEFGQCYVLSPTDSEATRDCLSSLLADTPGELVGNIEHYERRNLTQQLAGVLDDISPEITVPQALRSNK